MRSIDEQRNSEMGALSTSKPMCYGDMFPDLSKVEVNARMKGKVFTVQFNSVGIGVQSREMRVDEEQWERCVTCPHYRSCYDLSMAKLALFHALRAAS
jgi:hypothetical protein